MSGLRDHLGLSIGSTHVADGAEEEFYGPPSLSQLYDPDPSEVEVRSSFAEPENVDPDRWAKPITSASGAVIAPHGPLLALATDATIGKARYGFAKGRSGGAQYANPQGFKWPVSNYTNCCTFAVQALHLSRRMLGDRSSLLTRADWNLGMMIAGQDSRGVTLLAHQWAIADQPSEEGFSDLVDGYWYVCQGWKSNGGGHSFFAQVNNGGIVVLEANGRPKGGSVLGGLDGVGSRSATPRCGRDWPEGSWAGSLAPVKASELKSKMGYTRLFTALLI